MGYLTVLAWCDLRGHLDYVERNVIEKWFQTLAMRIDRFHQTWMGGSASARVVSAMFEPSESVMDSNGNKSSDRSGEAFVGRAA
jgi:hypothetical protein